MTDLVLESRSGREEVILPNVPGQLYTFGSEYPGDRGRKEEFIFCKLNPKGVVNPTHFIISVDEQGNYWIQNDTRNAEKKTTRSSVFNTFVNAERVKAVEVRLLKIGDVISVGFPETKWAGPGPRPRGRFHTYFHLTERIIPSSCPQIEETENCSEAGLKDDAESPFANNLVLSEIMSYLAVPDLKNARLVSKKWTDEASKVLEKKGQVSFTFGGEYRDRQFSTRVSRYLHEMEGLKIQNLRIILKPNLDHPLFLSPGGPGVKMLDDLRKLLKSSHNFSSFFLITGIKMETDFLPFHLIFQELGGKLVELKLRGIGCLEFFPDDLPLLPSMRNLQKFDSGLLFKTSDLAEKWVSHFVPPFAKGLEHFTVSNQKEAYAYFEELVKHEMPNLKGIEIRGGTFIMEPILSLILQLKTPLTHLKTTYSNRFSELGDDCPLLESLLLKHSKSLRHLEIRIRHIDSNEITEFKLPSFPKLEELELEYDQGTRINWGAGVDMDYKELFPALQTLTIKPLQVSPADDPIINAFFPEGGEMRCETVTDLWVAALPYQPDWRHAPPNEDPFQPRIEQIREMFPNAVNLNFVKEEEDED